MVSLCIVLFCIFGFVGILNYQKMVSDADHTLSILADNDGTFPENSPGNQGKQGKQVYSGIGCGRQRKNC